MGRRQHHVPTVTFEWLYEHVGRYADAANGPEQLTLLEADRTVTHELVRTFPEWLGWVAECSCGHYTQPRARKNHAEGQWRRHYARTPNGAAIVGALRVHGRSANR